MTSRRVVRVITRLNIGGPARQALLLTKALRGDWPTLLLAGTPQFREGELSDPEVDVERVPLVRPIRPVLDVRAYRRLTDLMRRTEPAIVHTHMAKAGFLGRSAAYRSSPKTKTIHTFHGHVLDGYFKEPIRRLFVGIERRLAARTDALVAVSDEIRDQLLELRIGTPDRFVVIPLGFDLSSLLAVGPRSGWLRGRFGLDNATPLAGVLGRLAPIKDHATLFKAIARTTRVHLAVLGDGEMRAELEALAMSLGVADRIHFCGWVTDIAAAISDLDIVVLTSRNEGSPVALIEALACARPVVATDVGGVKSVVQDGSSGFLVSAGDDRAVAERLETLISNDTLRTQMGERGREFVRGRFGHERLVNDIRALYESLTASR